jgi:hypothetical protein
MSPKKIALWFLIVSVALSAVMGIIAILSGTFGSFQLRIILTTLTISGASICALASGALWESRNTKLLPAAGVFFALLGAGLLITGIWVEPHSDQYWKFTASTIILAVATAHTCLLALAKLARRFVWTRWIAFTANYFLAFLIVWMIYVEPKGDFGVRVIGVTSIIVAAMTIMTPIFHRLSRGDLDQIEGRIATPRLFATITCPQCGAAQENSLTETTCGSCGCKFLVAILDRGRVVGRDEPLL